MATAVDRFTGRRLIAAIRLRRYEDQITAAVAAALADARRRTLEQVRRPPMLVAAVAPSSPHPPPFDPAWWRQAVAAHVAPVAQSIFDDIAGDVLSRLPWTDSGLAAVDMTVRLQRFVGLVDGVGPDLASRLGSTLNTGVALGDSVDDLASRVGEEFDVGDRRARTIARTEVVGASNGAANDVASALWQSGVRMTRTWLAADDDRTRDTHIEADGQTVGFDEPFQVGDALLMYPGDPDGPPEEVINCRCTVTFDAAEDDDNAGGLVAVSEDDDQ